MREGDDLGTEALEKQILDFLKDHPEGATEYELLAAMGAADWGDELEMFAAHFLLFHALYRLRSRLEQADEGSIRIHCLQIMLETRSVGDDAVDRHDALAAYYLDTANLRETSGDDVRRLLSSFWASFDQGGARERALEALGLEDPVDLSTIKRRYRALAKKLHPDVGGDADRLAVLNAAMEIFRKDRLR